MDTAVARMVAGEEKKRPVLSLAACKFLCCLRHSLLQGKFIDITDKDAAASMTPDNKVSVALIVRSFP